MKRNIMIEGREVAVFNMDLPKAAAKATSMQKGRPKSWERQVVEMLKPGEATDVITGNYFSLSAMVHNVRKTTGKSLAMRKEGAGVRIYCSTNRALTLVRGSASKAKAA